jgi:hypothetical protein
MNVPDDVARLVQRVAAAVPANTWHLEDVRRRGIRRRWVTPMAYLGRRRRGAGLLVAAGVALAAAGGTTVFGTGDGQPVDPAVVVWAGAADADHLYAIGADCPEPRCLTRFLGSDDGGRTWTERNERIVVRPTFLPGGELFAVIVRPDTQPRLEPDKGDIGRPLVPAISADGGRTWQDLSVSTSPRPAATAAELPVWSCDNDVPDTCGVFIVDPVRRELRPLATQPSLDMADRMSDQPVVRSADGRSVWATGEVTEGGPMTVAVSRDGGGTWTNGSIPCRDCHGIDLWPITPEVAYVTGDTGLPLGSMLAFRTTDAGLTWQPLAVDFHRPHGMVAVSGGGRADTRYGGAIVTTDGQLVIAEVTAERGQVVRTWISRPDSAEMTPVTSSGFPTRLTSLTGGPSTAYLATSGTTATVAHSVDGRTWSALAVR